MERHGRDLLGLVREVERGGITRRQFVHRLLGLGLGVSAAGALLAACGDGGADGASPSPSVSIGPTTKRTEVYLCNWSDYMAPGVKKDFEKKTGIKVVETYYAEEILAELKAGATGYDIVVLSDYMVGIMIDAGLVEPLAMQFIPNLRYVESWFANPVYDDPAQNGGLRYSVPYQWGTTGLAVRADKVDSGTVGRWADIFPPASSGLKGQIQMLNDPRECPGAALIHTGSRDTGTPYSINTTDQAQLDAATQALIDQKPDVRAYDSVNMKRSIVQGTPVTMCWTGDALMAIDAMGGDDRAMSVIEYVHPAEGFAWWADCLVIPKGYRSKYAAHLLMDYLLTPEVQGKLSSWTRYLSPCLEAARPYTDPFALLAAPTAEDMERGQCYTDVGDFTPAYEEAWSKVKSA